MNSLQRIDKLIKYYETMIFTQDFSNETLNAIAENNIIIDALKEFRKSQIAIKPKRFTAFDGIERNGCPTCPKTNEILYAGQKYCSVCGQKIDWSDNNDTRTNTKMQ